MIANYKLYLYDKANTFLCELPFESISYEKTLNNIWTASSQIEYTTLKTILARQGVTVDNLMSAGLRWVDISRNNITQFRGILNEPVISKNGNTISLGLSFKSWLAYFSKCYTSEVYSGIDAGEIAWGNINVAQARTDGSIGVTKGTVTATKDRDRTFSRDEIASSIIGMAYPNIKDGFDFEISDTKVFTANARLGSDKPAIVFDDANIIQFQINYKVGLNIITQSIQLGNGTGVDQKIEVRTASNTYTNKWYLQEKINSNTSVSEATTLQEKGDAELTEYQDYSKIFNLSVDCSSLDVTSFDIGDKVTIQIKDLVSGLFRINKKTVSVQNGLESCKLEFI